MKPDDMRQLLSRYKFVIQLVLFLIGVVLIIIAAAEGVTTAVGISLLSVGGPVATSAVISVLITWLGPQSELERDLNTHNLLQSLTNTLDPRLDALRTDLGHSMELESFGIIGWAPRLDPELIGKKMRQCHKRIQFLDTWFCEDIPRLEAAFEQAAASKVPVELIILKPAEIAKLRSIALGRAESYVVDKVEGNLSEFRRIAPRLNNLTVKLSNELPSIQISVFDDEAYVGFFLHGTESSSGTQLKVLTARNDDTTLFGKILEGELTRVSGNAQPFITNGVAQMGTSGVPEPGSGEKDR